MDGKKETGNQPVETAYSLGWKPVLTCTRAYYVDQASSLTLFFKRKASPRGTSTKQIYAWKKHQSLCHAVGKPGTAVENRR